MPITNYCEVCERRATARTPYGDANGVPACAKCDDEARGVRVDLAPYFAWTVIVRQYDGADFSREVPFTTVARYEVDAIADVLSEYELDDRDVSHVTRGTTPVQLCTWGEGDSWHAFGVDEVATYGDASSGVIGGAICPAHATTEAMAGIDELNGVDNYQRFDIEAGEFVECATCHMFVLEWQDCRHPEPTSDDLVKCQNWACLEVHRADGSHVCAYDRIASCPNLTCEYPTQLHRVDGSHMTRHGFDADAL